jgi:hypothetical protein
MIIGNFGHARWLSLDEVGVHEQLGGFRWRMHPKDSGRVVPCAW